MFIEVLCASALLADAKPPEPDPADCFCSFQARDFSIGHFEDGGATFVVYVPLTPGPGEVMRSVGERIPVGMLGVTGGFALLAQYRTSANDFTWCAQAVPSDAGDAPEPDDITLTNACMFALSNNYYQPRPVDEVCSTALTVEQIASLFPKFESDGRCSARIRKLGIEDPNYYDDGCAGGGTSLLGLLLLTRRRRR